MSVAVNVKKKMGKHPAEEQQSSLSHHVPFIAVWKNLGRTSRIINKQTHLNRPNVNLVKLSDTPFSWNQAMA